MDTKIDCHFGRDYGSGLRAPWVVMMMIRNEFARDWRQSYPTCAGVIDDFGTLVLVGDWS